MTEGGKVMTIEAIELEYDGMRGFYKCGNCCEISGRSKSIDGTKGSHCSFCGKKVKYVKLDE